MATAYRPQIDELEAMLARLASDFRSAEPNSTEREAIAFRYGRVFDNLLREAGRFVEPDFDSLLPDGYMPTQYEARKAQLVQNEVKAEPSRFQWVFRLVGLKPWRQMLG
jgi:hypothetical protein